MNIRELLGTELPIVQAPMAGVQGSSMAIAVSAAGGLGSLPCAMLSAEALGAECERIRAATDRPYNLNFFCHAPPPPDPAADAAWRALLAPYYAEFGIPADTAAGGASRAPFSHAIADLIEPFRPPVVSFHFGLPAPDLLARVKDWGATVLSSATTVEEALWLEAHGADAIIAQGLEAGGHRGIFLTTDLGTQLGTFALVPQLIAAVKVPVIAAGGISTPQGVAAALALGASAVQAGTAYLLADEASTGPLHRRAIASERARHTVLTNLFSGRPARGIVNRLIAELGAINPAAPAFPNASAALAPLRAAAERAGDDGFTPLWCGQNASGCRATGAAEITRELARGLRA